jgi:hypothetical protein
MGVVTKPTAKEGEVTCGPLKEIADKMELERLKELQKGEIHTPEILMM